MKKTLITALLFTVNISFGQNWEVGFNTGTRLCLNNGALYSGPSFYAYLSPNELVANNGIYINRKISRHFSVSGFASYSRIVEELSSYETPPHTPYISNYYFGILTNNNYDYGILFQYDFWNKRTANKIKKIRNTIGSGLSLIHTRQRYFVIEDDYVNATTKQHTTYDKYDDYFFDIKYMTSYDISKHCSVHASLTGQISASLFDITINHMAPEMFAPYDYNSYISSLPGYYLNFELGVGYKF